MQIPLSRGQVALIDAQDYILIAPYRWYAIPNRMGGFYASARPKNITLYMHRVITAAPRGSIVDHRNHDTLDNRRANLHVGTQVDNMQNGSFALRTHCLRGHEYNDANTYHPLGTQNRRCRECHRLDQRQRAAQTSLTPEQKARRNALQRVRRARAGGQPPLTPEQAARKSELQRLRRARKKTV